MSLLRLTFAAGFTALLTGTTLAQGPVAPVQGPDCGAMIAQYGPRGLWMGRFAGGREVEVSMLSDQTIIQSYSAQACFRSQVECDRWLYALNTQFQDRPGTSVCRRLRG